jgi:ATP-dependent DNA helicase RecQ
VSPAPAAAELNPDEAPVLQALKDWRREQARQQGVPPYVVFHDRTLVEVVARRPRSLEELAGIGGVGQAKLDRYGVALLASLDAALLQ